MNVLIPVSVEKVPCPACRYVGAIKWNADNNALMCHNCGQVVECVGFSLLVEGIALPSNEFHEELGAFNTALHKFITEYPSGASLLTNKVTFTDTGNPFETNDN